MFISKYFYGNVRILVTARPVHLQYHTLIWLILNFVVLGARNFHDSRKFDVSVQFKCRGTTCVSVYVCMCVMRAGGEIGQQTCVWSKYSAKVLPVPNHPWPIVGVQLFQFPGNSK